MKERRYSRYKQADVLGQLAQLQERLKIEIEGVSQAVNSVYLTYHGHNAYLRPDPGQALEDAAPDDARPGIAHHAVILARSSQWYHYSLNSERFKEARDLTLIVCGTHDSCTPLPVLALDTFRVYAPGQTRLRGDSLKPRLGPDGQAIADSFEKVRRTHYGHNILLGALLMGREDALERLLTFKPSTRRRIEATVRRLYMRRRGRPLKLA